MVKILNMNDPKKKILQLISDTAKTRGDITQSPSAWQHFKSDLNSIVKYPFQSLRSKMKTGNIPYNLSGAIESGNTKSQPMDTAFDMVNVPGAVLNFGQKVFSGNASKTDVAMAGLSVLPVGKILKGKNVFKHHGDVPYLTNKEGLTSAENITNITRSKSKLLDKANLKNATFTPFSTNTPRAGMKVDFGDGLTQNYYKSSSLGDKFKDGKSSFNKWIAFEGKANIPGERTLKNPSGIIKDWFVKDEIKGGWKTGYGSKTNEYLYDNMDKHIDPNFAKSSTDELIKYVKSRGMKVPNF